MKARKPLTITSRTSSITNSFVQSIVPHIPAEEDEVREALKILGITPEAKACVYCGASATDWDHLRPLVRDRMPTGFVDDVRNRVPSCNRCNQSKGKADWRRWISGNAAGSPKRRGIRDLDDRIQRLEAFEKWGAVEPIQIERLIDAAHWAAHWANRDAILEKMHESQKLAEQMKAMIFKAYSERAKK